jgi:hypothetical protein
MTTTLWEVVDAAGVVVVESEDVVDGEVVLSMLKIDVVFAAAGLLDEVVGVLDTELLVVVVVFAVDFPVLVVDESIAVVLPVPNDTARALVTPPKRVDNGLATCFFSWRAKTVSNQAAWVRATHSARMERYRI